MRERLLRLTAPAKLNLFLHITGRRADGYHLLQTLFQLVDLCDELQLETAQDGVIAFAPGSDAPGGDDDLTLRAARALQTFAGVRSGVRVTLRKRLPMGGGLGGGSSDAATVLLGLNRLWALDLPIATLMEIGAGLGADVPVFVRGRTAWAEGVGEVLTPLRVEPAHYVIVQPPVHVTTGHIFGDPELTRDTPIRRIPAFFSGGGRNDCEPVVRRLYPEVARALDWLDGFGSTGRGSTGSDSTESVSSGSGPARLTGTGGCVFLACAQADEARAIARQCPAGFAVYVARSLDVSPTHEQLGLA